MTLTESEVADRLQSILKQHFQISDAEINMDLPLEELHTDFKILSNLIFLEQLLEKEFEKGIPLLENISTAFHSAKDISILIMKEL